MTYVEQQSSKELRAHMKGLKKMHGWHEPLADRLFREVEMQDAEIGRLRAALTHARVALAALPIPSDASPEFRQAVTRRKDAIDATLANEQIATKLEPHMDAKIEDCGQ